jgi:hypothetical protein
VEKHLQRRKELNTALAKLQVNPEYKVKLMFRNHEKETLSVS